MFDISLAKNFEEGYKQFLINTTKPLPLEYMHCFEGFVGNIFVKIGRSSFGVKSIERPDYAVFLFRNTVESVNRFLYFPVKYTISNDYNKPYYQFHIRNFKKILPDEFTSFLLNERCISESSTTTNFSRIIAGCFFKLRKDENQLKVHHLDEDSTNDSIDNLLPEEDKRHMVLYHDPLYEDPSVIFDEKLKNDSIFIDTRPYMAELKIKEYKLLMEKRRNYSKQFHPEVLFTIHYMKHIEGIKGFDKIKKYNGVELPSSRSIRKYLNNSFYREFEEYYAYITGDKEKLSAIEKSNSSIIF